MASNVAERWSNIWEWIKGRPAAVTRSIAIPPDNVAESGEMAAKIVPGDHYFAVFVNELFLTESRKWWVTVDPMAVVVCEFTYNKEQKTVPFVVGPSLLSGKVEKLPAGMVFTDTQVAGICPYVGGKLAISAILCQVAGQSFPRKLLNVVEKTAGSFPFGSALDAHLKVADAVLDGVEALFELDGAQPLIGHRWEYNDSFTPWLKPGFFALIGGEQSDQIGPSLRVERGRLYERANGGPVEFRRADYLLYSLQMRERRNDVTELPFYKTFQDALVSASSADAGAWDRAKAALTTSYQEMITSPDLTWNQAQELADSFQEKLLAARRRAETFGTLAKGQREPVLPAEITQSLHGMPHARERLDHILQAHKILELA